MGMDQLPDKDSLVWDSNLGMYRDQWGNLYPDLSYQSPPMGGGDVAEAEAVASGGSGGSGGGGWGGGGGGTIDYTDSDVRIQIANEYDLWMGAGWSNSHPDTIQYALDRGWGADEIRMDAVDMGANSAYASGIWQYVRSQVGDVSATVVQEIMRSGVYMDSRFESYIAPQYSGSSVLTNRQTDDYVELWDQYTAGKTMTWTAEQKLQEIANTYGYTTEGLRAWEKWLRTTESANAGNYGAVKRDTIRQVFMEIMHREPTEAELAQNSDWMDLVDGSMSSLNTAAFIEQLRGTEEYQQLYQYKPEYMTEGEWWDAKAQFNSVGNWYFNDTPFEGNGFEYTDEEIGMLLQEGWTASGLTQYYKAVEEAAYDKAVYGPMLEETFGSGFTDDEWFALANGGQGSGALRAKLVEAQSRNEFREAYRQAFGSDPGPADYDRITSQFVSPSELIREVQATNSAEAMYDSVNELMQRVYGESVSLGELKDMALGRAGTGELQAMINEAERLDQYRWIHKQYYGTEPTPADYAKYAGYAGTAELTWEITTNERIAELTPEIQEAWEFYYGNPMSDDDLKTMIGEQEGYGALKAMYKEAAEAFGKQEEAWYQGFQGGQANQQYTTAEGGGFQQILKPIAEM